MFTRYVGIAVVVTLLFCATPIHTMDPRLTPYVNEIMGIIDSTCGSKAYSLPQHTSYAFEKLIGNAIGVCRWNIYGYSVSIDTAFWSRSDDLDKFTVIAHEITHCVLKLNHSKDPDNYMYYLNTSLLTKIEVIEQLQSNTRWACSQKI